MMRSRWLQAVRHYAESSTQAAHAISTKQQLYVTDPITPGSVFFLPHGTRVMNKLVQFMKHQQTRHGFQEVITPLIYKTKLWEKSGHWENYKEDMFKVVGEAHRDDDMHEYGLKPMNCPGHCVIFDKFDRSYNELPVRLSDFSSLHRNEASGALSGLTRVRRFHQDDGHIFCELGHIESEIQNTLRLIQQTYAVFGIDQVEYYLSTRPTKFMGDIATWNEAEAQLARVLDAQGRPWQERPEDGAFYGPKIDVLVTDAFGKKHQVGTVQLDFQLPQRFDLKYVGSDNGLHRPIMVHRAVFGSLERFFAILLDHYQGKWPFWINPRQAVILPVNDTHVEAAKKLQHQLSGDIAEGDPELAPITGHQFYVDVDSRSETIGTRIKDAVQKGYSYIMLLGDKDLANGTVAIRTRDSRKVENKTPEDIYELFRSLEATYK
ncbi:hypothetical protein DICA0_F22914 [Diutina catenulata]